MKETINYKLRKPDQEDFYNVEDFNYNADIIDSLLKTNADTITQHINAAAPHSGHAPLVHTHSGSDITSAVANATNADMLDGKHASDFAAASHTHTKSQITDFAHTHVIADITDIANIRADSTKKLVVEVNSVAPANPVAGQIWFDSANKKFRGFNGAAWL